MTTKWSNNRTYQGRPKICKSEKAVPLTPPPPPPVPVFNVIPQTQTVAFPATGVFWSIEAYASWLPLVEMIDISCTGAPPAIVCPDKPNTPAVAPGYSTTHPGSAGPKTYLFTAEWSDGTIAHVTATVTWW